MILARLALRNLLRQRRRTALTLLVVVAGFLALSLAGGFMAQTFQGLSDGAIRGGTDGSRLSFLGLPTPNVFAGEHNFHSRLEWISVQDMDKAVEVIVNIARVWEERP